MGKASSSKKIARAARAGGRVSGVRQRNLMFPGIIGAVVLLGVGLVVAAHADHQDDGKKIPPTMDDHWHSAYGIYICDEFLPTVPAGETQSSIGIHTHGDSVVHIHPFGSGGTGENATLGNFLKDTGIELSNDEIKVGEQSWKEGDDKCGEEDGEVVVARWQNVESTDEEPSIIKTNFDDLRFRNDGEGYTIAFVPEGETDIPKPPSAANLTELGAVDAGGTTSTTAPTGSTQPGDTAPPGSDTTAPPASDTTAPTTAPATTVPEG